MRGEFSPARTERGQSTLFSNTSPPTELKSSVEGRKVAEGRFTLSPFSRRAGLGRDVVERGGGYGRVWSGLAAVSEGGSGVH